MMITRARPLNGCRVKLTFNNGVTKTVDLSSRLHGPMFGKLRAKRAFKRVRVGEGGCLEWPSGADICPNLLYYGGPPPWARKLLKVRR
jgi:hypothetical protein